MPKPQVLLDLYLHLAKASEEQGRPLQRDKFLVLAARVAQKSGWSSLADGCRQRIIKNNPNHILKRFPTMQAALQSDDITQYIRQLTRIYPFEKAEYLLDKFRASGYKGNHGFRVPKADSNPDFKMESPSKPPSEPKMPAAVRPSNSKASKSGPEKHSNETPANGSPAVRPALQKALAMPASDRDSRVDDSIEPPLSLHLPNEGQSTYVSSWTFFSWLIVTLALGITIGAAVAVYLFPGRIG